MVVLWQSKIEMYLPNGDLTTTTYDVRYVADFEAGIPETPYINTDNPGDPGTSDYFTLRKVDLIRHIEGKDYPVSFPDLESLADHVTITFCKAHDVALADGPAVHFALLSDLQEAYAKFEAFYCSGAYRDMVYSEWED